MKSPFAIFRKHRKTLTVILTGLAMFAFILMDQLMQTGDSFRGLPILMGVAVGAGILWVIGTQTGKPKEYAMAGAIIGAALGFVLVYAGDSGAVVKTDAGSLTERDLQNLIDRRRTANGFIMSIVQQARAGQPELPFQLDPDPQSYLFQFGRSEEEDVVLGYLLNLEARKLGLTVTDEAISAYIREAATITRFSQNEFKRTVNVTRDDHRAIVRNMRMSEPKLYDMLREEMLARLAFQLLLPQSVQTPEQHWQAYRKVHVQQELDATAVPVEAFVDESRPVEDATLRAFFEEHRMAFPNQLGEGSPGFRQPHRVSVGYATADFLTIEEEVTREYDDDPKKSAQLDEEVVAYYEANKDRLYRKSPPQTPQSPQAPQTPQTPQSQDGAETPDAPAAPSDGKPADEQPADDKPADDRPADQTPADDQPADEQPNDTQPNDAEPNDAQPNADGCDEGDEAAAQTEQPATEPNDPPAAAKVQAADAPVTDAPATDAAQTGAPADDVPQPDAPQTDAPATDAPQAGAADDAAGEATPAAEQADELPVEYQELDDLLRMEIRGQLLTQKTIERMLQKIESVQTHMRQLGLLRSLPETHEDSLTAEQVEQQLRDYARKLGLGRRDEQTGRLVDSYVVTDLMSAQELQDSAEHPIGRAIEPASIGSRFTETVIQRLFRPGSDQTYLADEAVEPPDEDDDPFGLSEPAGSRYAYWKVEDVPSHVPTFDDPGIREQVQTTWRLLQAREAAQERAQALKAKVEQALAQGQTMAEALGSETVTGRPDDLQLTVLPTNRFSWLRLSSAAPADPRQPQVPQLSSVDFIPKAGDDFMRTVFQELDNGEVGVAANTDRSVYYVVHVKDRVPSGPGGEASLRQEFMEVFSMFPRPYMMMADRERQRVNYEWVLEFEKQYNVRWTRPAQEYYGM